MVAVALRMEEVLTCSYTIGVYRPIDLGLGAWRCVGIKSFALNIIR